MTIATGGIGGINVTQLVTQMMQIESRPQTLLKNQQTKSNDLLAAFQALAGTFFGVQSAAQSIVGVNGTTPWSLYTANSSSLNVSATAASTAVAGTYGFNVTSVAAAHSTLYSGQNALTAVASTGATIGITQGGVTTNVTTTDTTLAGVVSAINSTVGLGVKAAAVQTGVGLYSLQLNAVNTGVASQFTVTGLTAAVGTSATLTTGADAAVTIGANTVTSATNTFTNTFPGVTFTVSKIETGDTITVGNNLTGMTNQVQSLVTGINSAIGQISSASSYNATSKSGGPLLGQLLPSQLKNALQDAVVNVPGGGSLASIGIQLDRNGNLAFDSVKFSAAMAANPASVQSLVTGLAQRVNTVATGAVNATTGSITNSIQGNQSQAKFLTDSIASWDIRLAQRKAGLQRQFSSLATALARMQTQQSWLSGQFATMSR